MLNWLAVVLACATLAVALAALAARSLFVLCMQLAAAGALGAAAVLALRAGDAALLLALFVAVWAPILMLAAMLLTSRTLRPGKGGTLWFSLAAAAGVVAVLLLVLPELGTPLPASQEAKGRVSVLLAPLLLAAAAASIGLLGFGERGVLDQRPGASQ